MKRSAQGCGGCEAQVGPERNKAGRLWGVRVRRSVTERYEVIVECWVVLGVATTEIGPPNERSECPGGRGVTCRVTRQNGKAVLRTDCAASPRREGSFPSPSMQAKRRSPPSMQVEIEPAR